MIASRETQAPPDAAPALDYDAIIIERGIERTIRVVTKQREITSVTSSYHNLAVGLNRQGIGSNLTSYPAE